MKEEKPQRTPQETSKAIAVVVALVKEVNAEGIKQRKEISKLVNKQISEICKEHGIGEKLIRTVANLNAITED